MSRPTTVPATPPVELRRYDFCWTNDGEILTLPDFPCADMDTCGCGWSFAGVTSARATSWGVVELRSERSVAAEVASGKHLAGWSVIEGFYAHILAGIEDIRDRVRQLPVGAVVGIWALGNDRFSLYERSPVAADPVGPPVHDQEDRDA